MQELINFWPAFLLILVRIATFMMVVPIFSYRNIPAMAKIGLSFFIAIPIFFTIDPDPVAVDGIFLFLVLKEALVGLSIALIAHILMGVVQTAGGIIDFQMGFAMANVVDPLTGSQSPVTGQYLYIFTMLFLLATDGHHLLIDAIFHSYSFIPLTELSVHFGDAHTVFLIAKSFATMFLIAVQISIPIVASILMVDIALGILAKTVPQLNIFAVGFPMKILSGFILLFMVIGVMIFSVERLFEIILYAMRDLMRLLGQ